MIRHQKQSENTREELHKVIISVTKLIESEDNKTDNKTDNKNPTLRQTTSIPTKYKCVYE